MWLGIPIQCQPDHTVDDNLLQYLSRHRDIYWTDTFLTQMRWVRTQREARRGHAPALP